MKSNVFITGVSSGLGLALAEEYVNLGWSVYGVSRRKCPLPEVNWRATDLSQEESILEVLTTLIPREVKFDLVVLNAGRLGPIADLHTVGLDELKLSMDVNLWSNKLIIDKLFENAHGVKQVVAISSGASVSGNRGWNGYALSKASLNMLMKLYAEEFNESHFCAFAPGLIDTAMQDQICSMTEIDKFNSVGRIQGARGTETMPTPQVLAKNLPAVFNELKNYPSGAFVDIRKM